MIILLLLVVVAAALIFVVSFVRGKVAPQTRWEGAFRHIVALVVGLCLFAGLAFLGIMMDLFEKNGFSFIALWEGMKVSLILLLGGLLIVLAALFVSRR